jgi:cobalt-zinc-cadmium efflux system protein
VNPGFLILACRILLALVFWLASFHKILFPEAFAHAIFQYQILPDLLINATAITLPWVEFIAGFAILFLPRYKAGAAALMLLLLTVFALAMTFNIARGLDVSCGCFSTGADADPVGWRNVVRNLGYMLLAVIVFAEQRVRAVLRSVT